MQEQKATCSRTVQLRNWPMRFAVCIADCAWLTLISQPRPGALTLIRLPNVSVRFCGGRGKANPVQKSQMNCTFRKGRCEIISPKLSANLEPPIAWKPRVLRVPKAGCNFLFRRCPERLACFNKFNRHSWQDSLQPLRAILHACFL